MSGPHQRSAFLGRTERSTILQRPEYWTLESYPKHLERIGRTWGMSRDECFHMSWSWTNMFNVNQIHVIDRHLVRLVRHHVTWLESFSWSFLTLVCLFGSIHQKWKAWRFNYWNHQDSKTVILWMLRRYCLEANWIPNCYRLFVS